MQRRVFPITAQRALNDTLATINWLSRRKNLPAATVRHDHPRVIKTVASLWLCVAGRCSNAGGCRLTCNAACGLAQRYLETRIAPRLYRRLERHGGPLLMTTIIFSAYDMRLEELPDFDPTPIVDFVRAGLVRAEAKLQRKIVAVGRVEFKASSDKSGRERALVNFHMVSENGDADVFLDVMRPPGAAKHGPYRPVLSKPLTDVGGVIYSLKGRFEGIRSKSAYKNSKANPSKKQKINVDLFHARYDVHETILVWGWKWADL